MRAFGLHVIGRSVMGPAMFLPIAKRSRRHNARLGGRLKAKFKAKNKRRHRRLARHEQ